MRSVELRGVDRYASAALAEGEVLGRHGAIQPKSRGLSDVLARIRGKPVGLRFPREDLDSGFELVVGNLVGQAET